MIISVLDCSRQRNQGIIKWIRNRRLWWAVKWPT